MDTSIALHISMTDSALLEHISRLPHARANFKQLVRELGAKGDDARRSWSLRSPA